MVENYTIPGGRLKGQIVQIKDADEAYEAGRTAKQSEVRSDYRTRMDHQSNEFAPSNSFVHREHFESRMVRPSTR